VWNRDWPGGVYCCMKQTLTPRTILGRRARLALSAVLLPLGLATGCGGGLTDSPVTTTTQPEMVVVEGRPLRRRNGRLHRARSRRGHSRLTDRQALWLSPSVREALGNHWRSQGELEHASVVAFDDLAHRLAMVDAPADLLRRSLQAAAQEADHAERCFELAGRYLGESLRAGRLRRPMRLPRSRESELIRLAQEALRDGVLNEGYAAWLATQQLRRARDQRVQDTLAVIARDEAHHAELSADVLAWCCAVGGRAVVDAVHALADSLPARMVACVPPAGIDPKALADHGLLDSDPDGAGYRQVLADTLALVFQSDRLAA